MVLADPILGDGDGFANAEQVAGKIVVFDRGGVTFADKALRAQAAGAVGAAICQTAAPWPYFMKDARGQAEEGGLEIPVVMVKRDDGEHLKQALRDQADISCSLEIEEEKECIICRRSSRRGRRRCCGCPARTPSTRAAWTPGCAAGTPAPCAGMNYPPMMLNMSAKGWQAVGTVLEVIPRQKETKAGWIGLDDQGGWNEIPRMKSSFYLPSW
ncbi:unnamed protein product [Heterosigma akashiwo]